MPSGECVVFSGAPFAQTGAGRRRTLTRVKGGAHFAPAPEPRAAIFSEHGEEFPFDGIVCGDSEIVRSSLPIFAIRLISAVAFMFPAADS